MLKRYWCLLALTILGACRNAPHSTSETSDMHTVEPTLTASNPLLQLLDPAHTGVDFQNQIIETYENNITTNINMYNGGGLAVADFNNDGLQDIYFVCSNGKNKLYFNQGNFKFKDVTDAAGVASEEGFETAAAAVDINADGWMDIYVCRAGVEINDARRNQLFINNQDGTFTENARAWGLDDPDACTGVNFFDMDNDGDLDCYLLHYPTQEIYTNKIEAKLSADGTTYIPQLHPRVPADSDRLLRNDGNGKFVDVSQQAGVWNLGYGLSVTVSDFNHDGWADIYVGNDFIQPDLLYINNKNGTFTDQLARYFSHTSQHTMGTDLSDFDNDGWVDLYAVDMLSANNARRKAFLATNTLAKYTSLVQHGYFPPVVQNVLQRNMGKDHRGQNTFTDVGCLAGVYQTDWSWSGLLADFNNDGWRDIHVTNGYRRDVTNRDFIEFTLPEIQKKSANKRLRDIYPNFQEFLALVPSFKARNFIFKNEGDWKFSDVSGKWMTMPAAWSCGAAWADFDNDGDLDLVVNNLEQPAFIYQNLSSKQAAANFLQIKLKGSGQNTQAIGASVAIYFGNGQQQYYENYPTRGIFSTVETLVHFGLGDVTSVDKVLVRWHDGKTQVLENVQANQRLTLEHRQAIGPYLAAIVPATPGQTYFVEKTAGSGVESYQHIENEYNDFEQFFLNPWMVTDLSPLMAKGDVNADGREDFFVGNALDQPAALFVQTAGGKFQKTNSALFEQEKPYEDHSALFFDADGDSDQDLLLVSGGAEANSPIAWTPRLFLNDGRGNFSRSPHPMPGSNDVGLRLAAHDYDRDGDPDIFIGGRVMPGKWPLTPRSRVLRNEGKGQFTDATAAVAGDFERCGMVTDLQWLNIDAHPDPELVVVGEWMPLSVFKMEAGKLKNVTPQFGLEKSNGLWLRLAAADVDADGDLDLITGNMGLNTRYVVTADAPMRCFAKDFDKNGSIDPIMAYYEAGKLYPFVQKEVLNKQMPILKKKFLYARDYAHATVDKIYPEEELSSALNLNAYMLASGWWENQQGRFTFHAFPNPAQIFPMQSILVEDVTLDGKPDLLLAGNKYGMEVETNRCDAGMGCMLENLGNGKWAWVENRRTGFWARGDVRDLLLIGKGQGAKIVVSANNAPLKIFEKK